MKCPRCEHENPPVAKFCMECALPLAARCAGCGEDLPAGAKFCPHCGRPVTTESAPTRPRFRAPDAYTPKHLADRILTTRDALEGERKQVTVLFGDIKGSMELLADRDPEEARRILDPVLERMMEAVHRYEGTVNQVLGDGIMALFGAPIAHEDHAVRACYAALRMQDAIRRYTDEVRHIHGAEVQVRVGLNSGEVVVRSIGSDLRMDYTAVGQTTHLAARMEQLATPGSIRLTAETLALAEGYVTVRPLGPVPVKGLAERVDVFELTGAGTARTRLHVAAARGLSRFVGRDAEMDQLRQAAALTARSRGQAVAVVGEPGVGKSRLFYEFIHSHHVHGWLVLESGSVSYGKATAFLPLMDLLRAYFRIEPRDDVRTVRAKVTGTILTLDEALKDSVPLLLWLLEALGDDSALPSVDPAVRRQRTLDAAKRVLLRESRVQPLCLVFEDLHWIDAETQAFLDSLVESLPTAPILLAVNYRPEYRHAWGGKTYYRQLMIDALPAERAEELLEGLLGADPSVVPLKPFLIARTEGNPLFLEESVRSLAETGVLAGFRGAYRLVKPLDAVRVPPTVQAILAARIDRLPPDDKRVLQAASVVGKDVPFTLLQAVAGLDDDALREGLARLGAAELVYEARLFPELEYTFKHALTHEVAYSTLLQERRRALHGAIVEAVERLYADRLGEQVELLAHHAVRGHVVDKAIRYLRQAGARAVARSANREAVGLFEQALQLMAELPETAETLRQALEIHIAIGPALIAVYGAASPHVAASYVRARDLVDRVGGPSELFPVVWGLWYVNYTRGRYEAAHAEAERLLVAAQTSEDTGQLLEAHHALWATLSAKGRPAAARPHLERGIDLYDRDRHAAQTFLYGGHDPGVCSRWHLGLTEWVLGHPDRSRHALEDSLRLADELKHPLTTMIALWFATWVHYQRGDRDALTARLERLVAIGTEHGFSTWMNATLVLPVAASADAPDPGTLTVIAERLTPAESVSTAWRHTFCLCLLAELYGRSGQPDAGRRLLASISEPDRLAFYAPELHRVEGELLLRSASPAIKEAERQFFAAIDVARQHAQRSFELRATTSLARLWRARGKREDARQRLGEVYGWFTEGFDTADLRAARALLEELER